MLFLLFTALKILFLILSLWPIAISAMMFDICITMFNVFKLGIEVDIYSLIVIDVYLCSMYKARQNSVVNPYLDVRSLDCLGNELCFFTINIGLLIIYTNITVITNST